MLKLQYSGHLMRRTNLKRPWCWEGLGSGGGGDDRGWDSWMASPTQWTWVWVNSGSWWWTGRPGVLQSMGSQTVGPDRGTELNQHRFLTSLRRHKSALAQRRCGRQTGWVHVYGIGRGRRHSEDNRSFPSQVICQILKPFPLQNFLYYW